ncbi:hypothetical protein ABFT23_17650 [Nocardioides sp. C4-1]|uniref:hypothetical protein n=1 Tax=Nocardioides sp. C4-1 TaxID=3151851 RepID=UPI003264ADE4
MDAVGWVVVGVVAVVVLAAVVVLVLRRRDQHGDERRLAQAEELRGRAAEHTPDVAAASARARDAEADAEQARARAAQAEQTAVEAHRDLARAEAEQEDVVRQADDLDPRVDTQAPDYRPITGPAMKTGSGAPVTDDEQQTGGSHRA